ncbi:MAG TPA: fatty acid desaturase [Syntrophorhabdales bacterium]|nr:fatty acid desaturase [Syntrophorhabdales bacterium]
MTQKQEIHGRPAGQSGQPKRSILNLEFGEDRGFEIDVRQRVNAYFQQGTGRSPTGSWPMYLKTAIILACFATSYVLLVFVARSVWQGLPLVILLGLSVAGIGFNIAHDGGHRAYAKAIWANKLAAMTVDLIGVSSYVWFWKHAVIHDRYVNITGYDTDCDIGILGRLSPHSKRLLFHRWQHFCLWRSALLGSVPQLTLSVLCPSYTIGAKPPRSASNLTRGRQRRTEETEEKDDPTN